MTPIAAVGEGNGKTGARVARAPVEPLYSSNMSFFILFIGYITVGAVFGGMGVTGKVCGIAVMAALIGHRLKRSGRGWKAAGWGEWDPLRELSFAGGCAMAVWTISFFLLADNANQGAIAGHAHDAPKYSSAWWLTMMSSCVLTGIREELVYRGGLRAIMPIGAPGSTKEDALFVLASGVIFAAGHWLSSASAYVVFALIGAVFAATLVRSGSLRSVMLAHILVNTAHLFGLGNYIRYLFGQI